MKKRLVIAAAPAFLLISIAYVKALFSHQDRQRALSPDVTEAVPADLLEDYIRIEEAADRLDSLHRIYSNSLSKVHSQLTEAAENQSQAEIDSLRNLVENLRNQVAEAETDAREAEQKKTLQFERLVTIFYYGELDQLLSDISEYERHVSIKEIKAKARKYFGVSAESLNRIVKKRR